MNNIKILNNKNNKNYRFSEQSSSLSFETAFEIGNPKKYKKISELISWIYFDIHFY